MVCTADDLLGWKDFPKGLRVLLLDEDSISSAEIKSKLEEMDYIVSTFCNENEALTEISNRPESFHVAIVEVSTGDKQGSFKFLETVKNLPTIMISDIHCLSTMMKCIALGATEFLQKPLSEEKLRNIWQHVAHKAFNAGGSTISEPSKPIKETEVSMLHLQEETSEPENQNLLETENAAHALECDHEHSTISDKFPAPSTPQLKQGCRLLDYGDCQDQPNCSIEKEHGEEEGDSKSVETTCNNSVVEITVKVDPSSMPTEVVVKDEDSLESSKTTSNLSPHSQNKEGAADSNIMVENPKKASLHTNSSGNRASRKKIKVDWTPELHKRFVQAVEQLGIDQAIPSRILDLMKVDGLTRHNVASHLQKYRMHKRHIMPKEDDRRWRHPRDTMQRVYPQKPIMAYPPYHSNHGVPPSQFYPVWGHPSCQPSGIQMWGHHPGYPMWQAPESWLWNTNQGMHVDAWGCPVMPPSQTPFSTFPQVQNGSGFYGMDDGSSILKNSFDLNSAEEVIDRVVKEAMSKPWQPLPLGLKPPSTESVLSELHRQGICEVPPESQC